MRSLDAERKFIGTSVPLLAPLDYNVIKDGKHNARHLGGIIRRAAGDLAVDVFSPYLINSPQQIESDLGADVRRKQIYLVPFDATATVSP